MKTHVITTLPLNGKSVIKEILLSISILTPPITSEYSLSNKDVPFNKLIEIENKLNWELNNLLKIKDQLNKNALNSADATDLVNCPSITDHITHTSKEATTKTNEGR